MAHGGAKKSNSWFIANPYWQNWENLEERINLLDQVISLEPKNLDAYFYRALAKNDLGDYQGAIVDYSKIILIEPDADTYFNRGNSR